MTRVAMIGTGSQKVRGSTPLSSTKPSSEANNNSTQLSICPNSQASLSISLHRLTEGFLLSCKVENKSPATISFYKNILDKFRWFLEKITSMILMHRRLIKNKHGFNGLIFTLVIINVYHLPVFIEFKRMGNKVLKL